MKRKRDNNMNITELLDKPKIIGLIADVNEGKSNFLYWLIQTMQKDYNFSLYSFGLRCDLGEQKIYSVAELETITNSVVICDEFYTLFDLEDRKNRRAIENTLRLINHNNNILILVGLPDNYKKFIASKLDIVIFKTCKIGDFVNGSRVKALCTAYKGSELGSAMLAMPVDKAIVWNGHYEKITIPYLQDFDTKLKNVKILLEKNVHENVQ